MTDSSSPVMAASYDPLQVALSVLIAIAASYAALSLAGRVTATRKGARTVWLAGGATSMGSGIWAMHFVGMLAFHLPIAVAYDTPTILLALFLAIAASATALYVVSRSRMGIRYALISGSILGCGVAALHFLGMMAMRMAAAYTLNAGVVAVSVLLGIAFAVGGMWLGYYFREEPKRTAWKRLGAAHGNRHLRNALHSDGLGPVYLRDTSLASGTHSHRIDARHAGDRLCHPGSPWRDDPVLPCRPAIRCARD
jgi:NO-binding membrane sensor protein with MHYT domain